ncbi:hypothetical protein AAFF_G00178190 [Aldrovandia affinis]|uniref:Uncharacterized protein n=1 Tax=Aldrovandia affinis TaxID=143900 RepID=A0AAD7RKT9_9TELE|nr:hypothetical protein AAFF_G00178190 [Aldrovandia affinis]
MRVCPLLPPHGTLSLYRSGEKPIHERQSPQTRPGHRFISPIHGGWRLGNKRERARAVERRCLRPENSDWRLIPHPARFRGRVATVPKLIPQLCSNGEQGPLPGSDNGHASSFQKVGR